MFLIILLVILILFTIMIFIPIKCQSECYSNKLGDYLQYSPKNLKNFHKNSNKHYSIF